MDLASICSVCSFPPRVLPVLYFLSRRLLSEQHSVSVAGAPITIEVAVVNRKELGRSVCGHDVVVVAVVYGVWCVSEGLL